MSKVVKEKVSKEEELTNYELVNLQFELTEIKKEKLIIPTKYLLTTLLLKVEAKLEAFFETRKELVEKYGKDGVIKRLNDDGSFSKEILSFENEIKPVGEIKQTITFDKIKWSALKSIGETSGDYPLLYKFINFDE